MQAYGNVATAPVRKETKASGKGYYEFRIAESQRGPSADKDPTWYTVRIMKDEAPGLAKGDFVKITGKLKTDFYLSREGKPTGTLLILAFDAAKIARKAAEAPAEAPAEAIAE